MQCCTALDLNQYPKCNGPDSYVPKEGCPKDKTMKCPGNIDYYYDCRHGDYCFPKSYEDCTGNWIFSEFNETNGSWNCDEQTVTCQNHFCPPVVHPTKDIYCPVYDQNGCLIKAYTLPQEYPGNQNNICNARCFDICDDGDVLCGLDQEEDGCYNFGYCTKRENCCKNGECSIYPTLGRLMNNLPADLREGINTFGTIQV